MPLDQLQQEIDTVRSEGVPVKSVDRVNDKNVRICIAKGYETSQELTAEINGQMQTWTERRFLIQSTRSAEAATHSLQERVKKAYQALQDLLVRKQGKTHLKTRTEIDKAIQEVMKKFRVEGLLDVIVQE